MSRRRVLVSFVVALLVAGAAPAAGAQERITCGGEPATIVGTPGDDVIHGRDGNDVIAGLGGDDVIDTGPLETLDASMVCGDDGNDKLIANGLGGLYLGGAGDDLVRGGNPVPDSPVGYPNFLSGGPGNDVLDGRPQRDASSSTAGAVFQTSAGPVTVDLGAGTATGDGTDTLLDIDFVIGSPHDDVITGDGGPNRLDGESGSDVLNGRGGDDAMSGDPSIGPQGDDVLDGGAGHDALHGGDGNDRLSGGEGSDTMAGLEGSDELDGGPGTDRVSFMTFREEPGITLDLEAGTVEHGSDHSTITGVENVYGSRFSDSLAGDSGPNYLRAQGGDDQVFGRGGDDVIYGRAGRDVIHGDEGNDSMLGARDDDVIDGGSGSDYANGMRGFDTCVRVEDPHGCENTGTEPLPPSCLGHVATIVGTERADRIEGTPDRDVIWAGDGDDVIRGLGKADVVCAGPGDDVVSGGPGGDHVDGEDGADEIAGNEGPDRLEGGAGDDLIDAGISDRSSGTEALYGEDGNDTLDARSTSASLDGGDGADHLLAGLEAASLVGGPGDDILEGKADERSTAFVRYHEATGPVVVDLGAGTATGMGTDTLLNITDVQGSAFDDTITGNDSDNYVDGHGGNDEVFARAGDDFLWGDPGDDDLRGGDGADEVTGGPGFDYCEGETLSSCEA